MVARMAIQAKRRYLRGLLVVLSLLACSPVVTLLPPAAIPTIRVRELTQTLQVVMGQETVIAGSTVDADQSVTPTALQLVPEFRYIFTIVFENKEFGTVIGNRKMLYFNELAGSYTLLSQYYAVTHPSLPNYLALIGGDTFDVISDCTDCTQDETSLPDLIESSGRTWKTYQEDMPASCFAGSYTGSYAMKHNPFMYFSPIFSDTTRCNRSLVPLTQLYSDLSAEALPNYAFITPNLCNDAHDCSLSVADKWLHDLLMRLIPALDAAGQSYLIVITWDEGQGDHSCCGLPQKAGGRVATILISPQGRKGFEDSTPYTHYSLLKTIAESWHLAYLGHAADPENVLITAPWK
jgi:hypothetical protein